MRKKYLFSLIVFVCFSAAYLIFEGFKPESLQNKLKEQYETHYRRSSDINEHLPILRKLASECSSVVEIGVRSMVSTWGILQGLSENCSTPRNYIGIDLEFPPSRIFNLAKILARNEGICFEFLQGNDMEIDIDPTDLLFIDSLHTYCHLTYELEKFSSKVRKYIAMHDTSDPWGARDDHFYVGDYSEYPSHFDRSKRGLWPAVVDFLERHPEWSLLERRTNNHGFTILKRNEL
jgi:hypothetical protein